MVAVLLRVGARVIASWCTQSKVPCQISIREDQSRCVYLDVIQHPMGYLCPCWLQQQVASLKCYFPCLCSIYLGTWAILEKFNNWRPSPYHVSLPSIFIFDLITNLFPRGPRPAVFMLNDVVPNEARFPDQCPSALAALRDDNMIAQLVLFRVIVKWLGTIKHLNFLRVILWDGRMWISENLTGLSPPWKEKSNLLYSFWNFCPVPTPQGSTQFYAYLIQ